MKIATLIAASALLLPAFVAQAADRGADAYSVTIQFADLNLDRSAGVAKLYFRIQSAARRVCDSQASERLASRQTHAVCVERAISAAVAQIDRPALTEYVASRKGKPAGEHSRVAVR